MQIPSNPINWQAITVLWSPLQECFHRETLEETIKSGMESFRDKTKVDYILVGIFDTKEESDRFLDRMREKRQEIYFADETETVK